MRITLLALLLCLGRAGAQLPRVTGPTVGYTAPTLAPGSPAGSYQLSGFDSVTPSTGQLSIQVPVLTIGGRGDVSHTLFVKIQPRWRVDRVLQLNGSGYSEFPIYGDTSPKYPPYSLLESASARRALAYSGPNQCSGGATTGTLYSTRTRMQFGLADGTQVALYAPVQNDFTNHDTCIAAPPVSRSRFVSRDGTASTFVPTTPVEDQRWSGPDSSGYEPENGTVVAGTLWLADGGAYVIGAELEKRDRHGNRITQTTDTNASASPIGFTLRDPLGRQVVVRHTYSDPSNPTYGVHERITFKGRDDDSVDREIRVLRKSLHDVLREGNVGTYSQLFDGRFSTVNAGVAFDPIVISQILLPNGQSYQFWYNRYGEVERIRLPTGGAIEYRWQAALPIYSGPQGISYASGALELYSKTQILRRVIERRTYPVGDAADVFDSKTEYTRPDSFVTVGSSTSISTTGVVTETASSSTGPLAVTKHYYYGIASQGQLGDPNPIGDTPWNTGKEWKTESYAANGTTLLKADTHDWVTRLPETDPRIVQTRTTLGSKTSAVITCHDDFNNPQTIYEYDWGFTGSSISACASAPTGHLRKTTTSFLTNYTPPGGVTRDYTLEPVHLRRLPQTQTIEHPSGGNTYVTSLEYDSYSTDDTHAPLASPGGIANIDLAKPDHRGNLTKLTKGGLGISYWQYDRAGNMVKVLDGKKQASLVAYDSGCQYGPLLSFTNALGHAINHTNDCQLGQPKTISTPNGLVSTLTYGGSGDRLDRLSSVSRTANGIAMGQKNYAYADAASNAASTTVTVEEDLDVTANSVTRRVKRQTLFDGYGRETQERQYETATAYVTRAKAYDPLGRVRQVSNSYREGDGILWTTTGYDEISRPVSVLRPDNATSSMQYLDNITRMIDEAGLSKNQETDALGRLVRVWEDPSSAPGTGTRLNYLTQYAYDGMANLRSVTQSEQSRTFDYDLAGRLVTVVNPESGAMTYQYDDAGNRTALIDGRGTLADQTVRFEFDTLNRLKKKTYRSTLNTPEVNYLYDTATRGVGLLGQVNVGPLTADSNRYTIAEYDPRGMIKVGTQRVDTNNFRFESTYNLMGARTTLTYPSLNAYATAYDDAGRIMSVSRGAQTYATVESGSNPASPTQNLPGYHASGAIQRLRMGTQLVEASVLNTRLQPSLIVVAKNGGSDVLGQLLYTYGSANNGNLGSQTIVTPQATRIHSYTYDRASRVESVRENGVGGAAGWWQRYVYDAYGNRALSGEASGDPNPNNLAARIPLGPVAQVVSSTTPLTGLFSGNRYTAARYDAVGSVIGYVGTGGSLDYLYDAENRLVCASKSGVGTCTPTVKPVEYVYDGYGRRVKKLVQGSAAVTYVYDLDGQLAAEVSSSSDPGLSYVFRDHLGSTRLTTDAMGGALRRFDYTPFGEDLTADVNGRGTEYSVVAQLDTQAVLTDRFTGKERDAETGLDYFGARYVSAAQGRFTSPDAPFADQHSGDPQSWNLYSYVRNRPLTAIDADGRAMIDGGRLAQYLGGVAKGTANRLLDNMAYSARHGDPVQRLVHGALQTDYRFSASTRTEQRGLQAGQKHGDTLLGVALVVAGSKGKSQRGDFHAPGDVPSVRVIVRGGQGEVPASGTFSGAQGETLGEAAGGVPHGTVRETTAGAIREAGGTVDPLPMPTYPGGPINGRHVNVTGGQSTFSPLIPNPVPKPERVPSRPPQ